MMTIYGKYEGDPVVMSNDQDDMDKWNERLANADRSDVRDLQKRLNQRRQ